MSIPLPLILISLAGLLVVVLLIMAALGAVRSRPSTDPNDDPRCGACGCIIAHPKDGICPTCRCSLSVVGLVLPFSKKRTPSWTARQAFFKVTAFPLALWTLVIVGLAMAGTLAIDQWILPYVWQTTSTVHARPRSGGYQSIIITTLEEYRAHGRAQFDSPSATKTSLLEFKTDTASHVLNVDLFAPSFSFTDPAGKLVTNNRVPTNDDLIAFMRASGIPLDSNAAQDAGVIAAMLSYLAPNETLVISSQDPRLASKLDTTQIVFSGGQWKPAFALRPLAMSISSGLWLFGFILIIWRQRKRRASVAAALLAPPLHTPSHAQMAISNDDATGGWDITPDADAPFPTHRSPPQLPTTALRSVLKTPAQPVNFKKA